MARRKRIPTTTAINPVRPPTATPEALSMKLVVLEVPRTAPMTVALLSASSAFFRFGILPSRTRPPRSVTPMRVPAVSKRSTKKKAKMMLYMAGSSALRKSICMKVGASEGGVAIRLGGRGWL